MPIGLAGLGGLYAERAGVVNIGLEGMMILGTWFGAWARLEYGPWWGVALGVLGGALGGLLHAVATVTFGVDHIVSGVAINILGRRPRPLPPSVELRPGGGATQSPHDHRRRSADVDLVPFLDRTPLDERSAASRHWFLVSDLAGLSCAAHHRRLVARDHRRRCWSR